ncbi:hypothetical protein D3C78_1462650 [compost metagenome]
MAFRFSDQGECGLLLRPGSAEYRSEAPADAAIELRLDARTMALLTLGQISLSDAVAKGEVEVKGDAELIPTLERMFALQPRKA